MSQFNPYDLIEITVNGVNSMARPYQFDSDIHNVVKMTNKSGELIKPIKIATSCPTCGAGMLLDVYYDSYPLEVHDFPCEVCLPPQKKLIDPFINPVLAGKIILGSLDPSNKPLKDFESEAPVDPNELQEILSAPAPQIETPKQKRKEKRQAKRNAELKKAEVIAEKPAIEPADGLTPEMDLEGLAE